MIMGPRHQVLINEIANQLSQSLRSVHGSLDSKHTKAWDDYGYKNELEFEDHYQMYRRFGIAKAGIKMPVNFTWKTFPKIMEGEEGDGDVRNNSTPWETLIKSIFKSTKLMRKLKRVDEFQRVGHYGAFVVQIRGNQSEAVWDKPLLKIRANQIVKFIPLYEVQLSPTAWDNNEQSERYGQPNMYQFQESNLNDSTTQDNRVRSVQVHHSRVIIFAEGADDESIYGVPANEAGFNDLITMEKIIGAGGEGFWKSAAMKTVYTNTNKDAPLPGQEEIDEFNDAIKDFVEGLDKSLMTGGLDPKVLTAAMADPKEPFTIALQSYCAGIEVAAKLLIGSQEGKLASEEDARFTMSAMQSRREDFCTIMVQSCVDWMTAHGIINKIEYYVEWDDLLAPSDKDKLELGQTLSKILIEMHKQFGETPTDISEVATIMGYKPFNESLDVDEKDPEDLEDETADKQGDNV
jgi:hypothetical protein